MPGTICASAEASICGNLLPGASEHSVLLLQRSQIITQSSGRLLISRWTNGGWLLPPCWVGGHSSCLQDQVPPPEHDTARLSSLLSAPCPHPRNLGVHWDLPECLAVSGLLASTLWNVWNPPCLTDGPSHLFPLSRPIFPQQGMC